jgi:polyphosphate glucokinase
MSDESRRIRTLAIDIGGSGIKILVLDEKGTPVTERQRQPTPSEPTPPVMMEAMKTMIAQQGEFDRISVGFPGVVIDGEVRTAANLHPEWIGFNLAVALEQATGKPARVANDADVQGLAVVEGKGVELVLTLGTGLGSALFVDGLLVPNLEVAHHPFRKRKTYEDCLGEEALEVRGKDKWQSYLLEAIEQLEHLFNYRMLYVGGGNAKKIDVELPPNVKVVSNMAGLLGGIYLWRHAHGEAGGQK